MFSAAPARASLVETASRMGLPFLSWLLAAMVTGPSATEWASFARVFPVQGAMTSRSSSPLGPMGSTSSRVVKGGTPHIEPARAIKSLARPNRLSVEAEAAEKMGVT